MDQSQVPGTLLGGFRRYRPFYAQYSGHSRLCDCGMKWSRKRLKIGLRVSIGLILMLFLLIGYQHYIPIQFTSETARSNTPKILVMLIPIITFIAMGFHYFLKRDRHLPILHIFFGTILGTGFLVFATVLSFITPQWSDEELLHNGRFTNQQIILQNDDWGYGYRVVRATPIVSGVRYITPADTTNLPEHKWVKSTKVKNTP